MAKFELKFIDACDNADYIKCEKEEYLNSEEKHVDAIFIRGEQEKNEFLIILDKSTAIKFAKTLRTEINKITESEVNHE